MATRVFDKADTIRATLKSVGLFSKWPHAPFDALCAAAQLWQYGKGEAVIQAAEPTKGLYVLMQGSLLNGRSWPNGKQMASTIVRPGWPFGFLPAWDGLEAPFTAQARVDCLVILIPRAALMGLIRDDPERLREFIDFLTVAHRQDIEGLQVRIAGSLRCLMAKYLAYLSRPSVHMSFDDPASVDPTASDVTQDEMAAMLGTARQTVNKMMKRMEREGILVRRGNTIRVVNFLALLAAMEEDEPLYPAWREQIVAWHEKLKSAEAKDSARPGAPAPGAPLHR
ncbi:MAG: Crp/Fnr family transcriptional regulator [Rhizomicrobium sp.]